MVRCGSGQFHALSPKFNFAKNDSTLSDKNGVQFVSSFHTRFNKIAIQCKGRDGKWTRKLTESPTFFHVCVTSPPDICVNLVFEHIQAASKSVNNLFQSFIVLCEYEYFLISTLIIH